MYVQVCVRCGRSFDSARPARTCSGACRQALYMVTERTRRARLAERARAAAASGDVAALTEIALLTAARLHA